MVSVYYGLISLVTVTDDKKYLVIDGKFNTLYTCHHFIKVRFMHTYLLQLKLCTRLFRIYIMLHFWYQPEAVSV